MTKKKYFPFMKPNLKTRIKNIHIDGIGSNISIVSPNYCPFDSKESSFKIIYTTKLNVHTNYSSKSTKSPLNSNDYDIQKAYHFGVLYQCNRCGKYCVIDYKIPNNPGIPLGSINSRIIPYDYGSNNIDLEFSPKDMKILKSISSRFPVIFKQANEVENLGLNQIYPGGYRKALEYLVAGYLINVKGTKSDDKNKHARSILNNTLSENIKKTDDDDLKEYAKAASWAGNNSLHTKTRDPGFDANTLKTSLLAFAHRVIYKVIDDRVAKKDKTKIENSEKD